MAAKKKLTDEQIKKARTLMSTRQPNAPANASKVGKPTVDPSKGRAPKYENKQKAYDALNAAGKFAAESAVVGLGGGALLRGATKLAAQKAGKYVGKKAYEEALKQNMKGLTNATGAGGKVSKTQTPMGPTLRSTKIGSPAEQAARVDNLTGMQTGRSVRTGSGTGASVAKDILKVGAKTKQVGTNVAGIGIGAKNRPKKK